MTVSTTPPLPVWVRVVGILLMIAGMFAGVSLVGKQWGFIAGGILGGAMLGAWTAYWQKRLA